MRQQNRKVCLIIDNFSGHDIVYEPTNIQIEFLAPNMTSFVQPLDAGIIRCFKAHYRQAFCIRALDLDDAGEQDIYKIDLLEAMLMAENAWTSVTAQTIMHCWDHTEIQREPILLRIPPVQTAIPSQPPRDAAAWEIIHRFARTDMTLPQAEDALVDCLGADYVDAQWRPALAAVMA